MGLGNARLHGLAGLFRGATAQRLLRQPGLAAAGSTKVNVSPHFQHVTTQ